MSFIVTRETGAVVYGVAGNVERRSVPRLALLTVQLRSTFHLLLARATPLLSVLVAHPMLEEHYIEFIALFLRMALSLHS